MPRRVVPAPAQARRPGARGSYLRECFYPPSCDRAGRWKYARAALDDALDRLLAGKVKNDRGEDFMTALCRDMVNAPLSAIEQLLKACPEPQDGAGAARFNIGNLYLAAVQAAQPSASSASTPQPGDDAKVIDAQEW
jgi:hypothetical protein